MTTDNAVTLNWAYQFLSFPNEADVLEPVTEAELRQQLRVDENIESFYLQRLARVGRRAIERYTSRSWVEQELQVRCQVRRPILPLPLSFPMRNIMEVTLIDGNGDEQPIAPSLYQLALGTVPVSIDLTAAADSIGYRVKYRAGETTPPPDDIRHAILVLAAWAYNNPTGTMPESRIARMTADSDMPPMVRMLLEPYRLDVFSW